MDRFRYLTYGLAALLLFIAMKLLLSHVVHISIVTNFVVIAALIGAALVASLGQRWWQRHAHPPDPSVEG
jgi:tellurite resistance protein TerC